MNSTQMREQMMKDSIKTTLEKVGVRNAGRHPFTTNYLPKVLGEDEHIMTAVFGRKKESEGFFGFVEGMLVATDKRVLFIDHRPGYTMMDELSYDVVSGVNVSSTVFYASVTLFTKIANYELSFASHEAAENFARYIESRVIKRTEKSAPVPTGKLPYETKVRGEALDFLVAHETGVLSSVGRTGAINAAVVYYAMHDGLVYFVTKTSTRKADDILGNQHVTFVVFDEATLQTLQIQGVAEQVKDEAEKALVTAMTNRSRTYADGSHASPLMRMGGNDFVTFRIVPVRFDFADYRHATSK